jgi:hypothetical protein
MEGMRCWTWPSEAEALLDRLLTPFQRRWRMDFPAQPAPSDWRLNPLGFARTG